MQWLPKGTHDWKKFITPDELFKLLTQAGFEPLDRQGFVFNKLKWSWSVSFENLDVNYVTTSKNPI
jgi:2-polyprenyl-6-hydroxyphenyl methylase/3-demethylubiquinone-9 3-methyltransferase